jgi:hypothetical protein
MDTQVNESFNNQVAWLAPKNKVYCGTLSLGNRIGIALGIKSIGLLQYFTRLFKLLGIAMTPNVVHYLTVKEGSRFKRLHKIKTKEVKTKRIQERVTKQKDDEVIAKRERSRRDGTYKSGQNMMPTEEEEGGQQPPRKKTRKNLVCRACKESGHATERTKTCKFYVPRVVTARPVIATADTGAPDAAADIDAYDQMALVEEDESSDVEDITLEATLLNGAATASDSDGVDLPTGPI